MSASPVKVTSTPGLSHSVSINLTLAEEKTRRAIAAKLHDSIGYSMVSMLHILRNLHEAQSAPEDKKNVSSAIEEMEKLIQETRSFTFDISPPILYEVGLSAAIEARCEHMQANHGIKCSFKSEGKESNVGEEKKVLLYQMIHELLVNVIKHAEAANVLVIVRWGMKKIQIIVEDDGKGFSHPNVRTSNTGMGLFSIRERLRSVGGEMKIVSVPLKGTTISLVAPISAHI